uniref:Catalase core domain-containing protein n=1 Tax=Romanomermis culicivorax TaxID=13658 RepID=A0A915JPW0_ROMCU
MKGKEKQFNAEAGAKVAGTKIAGAQTAIFEITKCRTGYRQKGGAEMDAPKCLVNFLFFLKAPSLFLLQVWSRKQYPLIPVGKIVLNRNPTNYFADVEQAAFSPAHMIPGIEPSPDKMLQGRLFAYTDTHFHRLGANYQQLAINCPYRARVHNYQRDGPMAFHNQDGAPNYFPNSFGGPKDDYKSFAEHKFLCSGDVQRYNSSDEDNFTQPKIFWNKVLNEDERKRLVENIAGHLSNAQPFIREKVVNNFAHVDPDFGRQSLVITLFNLFNHFAIIEIDFLISSKAAFAETPPVASIVSKGTDFGWLKLLLACKISNLEAKWPVDKNQKNLIRI